MIVHRSLPSAQPLPKDLNRALEDLGNLWASHPRRPHLNRRVLREWDLLLKRWSEDRSLPLLIRKKEKGVARGEEIRHSSGRELVLTDNSPASWSYMLAFEEKVPSLPEIHRYLERDEIPIAMVTDREMSERSRYTCMRKTGTTPNDQGWKVCLAKLPCGEGDVLRAGPSTI